MKHGKFLECRLWKEFCKDKGIAGVTHFGFGCGINSKMYNLLLKHLKPTFSGILKWFIPSVFRPCCFILDKNTDEIRSTVDFRLGFFWFF